MPTGKAFHPSQQRGFTYVLLLFAIALLGLGLGRFSESWSLTSQREKEQDLLFAGRQIRGALRSYVAQTPVGKEPLPKSIHDLLEDTRHQPPRHHLRRNYFDPFSGKADWLLIRQGDYLLGVSSHSEMAPLQKQGFNADEGDLAGANRYRDWKFAIPAPAPAAATNGAEAVPASPPATPN